MKLVTSVPLGQKSLCNVHMLEEQYRKDGQLLDVIKLFPQAEMKALEVTVTRQF
jgi:hypothetical protein